MSDLPLLQQANFINNEWVHAVNGETVTVINPATGAAVGTIPKAGRKETKQAIDAASIAFNSWKKLPAADRADHMMRLYEAMMAEQEQLARIITLEMGKPLAEAKGEIAYGASFIKWFAEEAKRIYGDVIPSPWPDRRIIVTKEPVGVVGAITPWNFPNSMITRKLGAALAAGCTVVAKPATQSPFSALAIAKLAEQVGFPAGVFNVVTGSASQIADEMCEHPHLRKITFTGSTEVGKHLAQAAGRHMKRVSMELGGNAPFIVFEDADLDKAVEGVMVSKFRNTGQTCVCTNRLLVQSSVAEVFTQKLIKKVSALTVGNGLEAQVDQGPLFDMSGVEKIEEHIADIRNKGGNIVLGGERHKLGGQFFQPTIAADVTPDMLVSKEETFGPLAPIFKFDTEAEAIAMANDTEYGLACYFYTQDLGRAFRVHEALEYGMVGVNAGLISSEVAPFGGVKDSGMGREGSHYGVEDYLNIKNTTFDGLNF